MDNILKMRLLESGYTQEQIDEAEELINQGMDVDEALDEVTEYADYIESVPATKKTHEYPVGQVYKNSRPGVWSYVGYYTANPDYITNITFDDKFIYYEVFGSNYKMVRTPEIDREFNIR